MTNAKIISTLIADKLSVVASGITRGVRASGIAMAKKGGEESKKSIPWVSDPVTGYYRPVGQTERVDAVELRELLLKPKNCRHN